MKVYQIGMCAKRGEPNQREHTGYVYRSNRKQADAVVKESDGADCEIRVINVEISKKGILRALNIYGGHPDNG